MKKLLGILVLTWTAMGAVNAAYPDKPIRLIVAFAPGSSTDIVARLIGTQLSTAFGQPVIVENKPGAGGNIATRYVMTQPADGHTLLVHSVAVAVNPALFTNAGYDAVTDLEPLAMAAVAPNLLYVHPEVKANNLQDLLALAKTGKLSYASSGIGTTTHLGAEWLFRSIAKVDITHVPFQPAAATNAVVGGQVPVGSTSLPPAIPFVKTAKVRPIAVMSAARVPSLPDVPTVAELVHKDFEATTWFALFAPSKTPPAVLDRLNLEIGKAVESQAIGERLNTLSMGAQRMDRNALRAYISSEVVKWGKLVKEVGIKPE